MKKSIIIASVIALLIGGGLAATSAWACPPPEAPIAGELTELSADWSIGEPPLEDFLPVMPPEDNIFTGCAGCDEHFRMPDKCAVAWESRSNWSEEKDRGSAEYEVGSMVSLEGLVPLWEISITQSSSSAVTNTSFTLMFVTEEMAEAINAGEREFPTPAEAEWYVAVTNGVGSYQKILEAVSSNIERDYGINISEYLPDTL